MQEPCTSSKCSHAYDKAAILNMIGRKSMVKCPVAGCNATLTKADICQSDKLKIKLKK